MPSLITLTTDFGQSSPYVAAMKGVILSVNSEARIHDLTHAIRPQDVRHASYFLAASVPYFPAGTIHVCVVDPGVGTERAILLAEAGGQKLLAPDNGCLSNVLRGLGGAPIVRRVTEAKYWRHTVSATFHGRDIFAPVAGHLSRGIESARFGPPASHWLQIETPVPNMTANQIRGEVIFIDDFGNLITNIPGEMVPHRPAALSVGKKRLKAFQWVQTYAKAAPGALVALISSDGWLEIAQVGGSAARMLRGTVGVKVVVKPGNPD